VVCAATFAIGAFVAASRGLARRDAPDEGTPQTRRFPSPGIPAGSADGLRWMAPLQVSGDPRRPSEVRKFAGENEPVDESAAELYLVLSLAAGMLALLLKVRAAAPGGPAAPAASSTSGWRTLVAGAH
jgi:hypothetical protein